MTAPSFDSIPAELREQPRWVDWRREKRNGKETKIPVDPRTGRAVYELKGPEVAGRVVSPRTAAQVMQMLRRVVEEGTGRRAMMDEYPAGGKTGTAQLLRADGRGYSEERYLSSFIGLAPADDPRLLVLVSLKAPSENGYYGGVAAAPACRKIIHRTLRYLKVPARPTAPAFAEAHR